MIFSLKLLMEGKEILESMNENIPSVLYWKISEKMFENEDFEKSINMIEDLSITDNNRLLFSLEVISKHYSEKLERTILDYMQDADEESVVFAMRCVDAPANIQLEASKFSQIQIQSDLLTRFLSVLTRTADIENLAQKMGEDNSLALAYPFRVLMVWHLMPAEIGVKKIEQLISLRKKALTSLEDSEKDDVLSDVSLALISLLGEFLLTLIRFIKSWIRGQLLY